MSLLRFFEYIEVEKRYSEKTIKAYVNDLSQLEDYFLAEIGHFSFQDIRLAHLRQWVMTLVDAGYSSVTINRKISTIHTFFKYLRREGVLVKDPSQGLVLVKGKKRLPNFVKPAEMAVLLDDVAFPINFDGIRNKLIIEFLYATGLRVSELVALELNNLDLESGSVRIFGKRNKERLVPLVPRLILGIQKYMVARQDVDLCGCTKLFITKRGTPIYVKLVYRVVVQSLELVTKQSSKSPHVLRHSFATVLLNSGAELNVIKEILGHASLAATQVYTHSVFKDLTKVYKQAHPRA